MALFGWKAGLEVYSPVELMEYAIAAEQAGLFPQIEKEDAQAAS